MEDIPADVAGLCLDTSHTAYSGMDPVETLRRYAGYITIVQERDPRNGASALTISASADNI